MRSIYRLLTSQYKGLTILYLIQSLARLPYTSYPRTVTIYPGALCVYLLSLHGGSS